MHLLARAGAILLGALMLLMLPTPQATAHIRTTVGYGVLTSTDSGADLALSLEYDLLARAVGMGSDAIDAADDVARAEALVDHSDALATYLDERITLSVDGVACVSSLQRTAIEVRQGVPYAALALAYDCPGSARGAYAFDYEVLGATDGVVDDHTLMLDYDLGGRSGETFLNRAYPSMTTGEQSYAGTSVRFATLGVEHILNGLDHILFVVALLLGTRTIRDVLKVASVFTLAHSVTLGLAALGWVELPATVVEPLIALSIVYVAVDNIVGEPARQRLAVVFGFGLLHGLGFAEALRITDDVSWSWIGSLLSFNLGVEIGQALLILVAFPTLVLVRQLRWSVVASASATSFVALIGLVWFFERVTVT
jgi:hydrogenase/urease accessory protein HupE